MFCEKIRVPGLPGEEDVTAGSVDNTPEQTDDETYEIVEE